MPTETERAATDLFDQDRQRFLTLYLDYLRNLSVPRGRRIEAARETLEAIRRINATMGVPHDDAT